MDKIIACGGGNLFKEISDALNELDRLKSENDRLKANVKEIAARDLQIAKEADVLSNAYKEEHEKLHELMLNIERARKEIEELKPNNPNFKCYTGETIAINNALEVFDKYLVENKKYEKEYEESEKELWID